MAEPVCGCLSLIHRLELKPHALLGWLLASALCTLLLQELELSVCWVSVIAFCLCFSSDTGLIFTLLPCGFSSCSVSPCSPSLGGGNLSPM